MSLLFLGPENGTFDSKQTQSRKDLTRTRGQQIKDSGPVTVALWAALFPPVAWAGGAMSQNNFDFLLKSLPQSITWPYSVLDTLNKLAASMPLSEVGDFHTFVDSKVSSFLLHTANIERVFEDLSRSKFVRKV